MWDSNAIDALARALATGVVARRNAVKVFAGSLVALSLPIAAVPGTESKNKKKGKNKKKRKGKTKGKKGKNVGGGDNNGPAPGSGSGLALDAEETTFLTLINDYRVANGRGALAHNAALGVAADAHSQGQATNNRTGHTGSDGSNGQVRIERAGYAWSAWGENVFWGDPAGSVAFDWWKNSPGHNANMLSGNFTEIGIGRAFSANAENGWFWTTVFGRPR